MLIKVKKSQIDKMFYKNSLNFSLISFKVIY